MAFQGEFARVFGPKRRGLSNEFGPGEKIEDSPEFHKYHLGLEAIYKHKIGVTNQRNRRKRRKK